MYRSGVLAPRIDILSPKLCSGLVSCTRLPRVRLSLTLPSPGRDTGLFLPPSLPAIKTVPRHGPRSAQRAIQYDAKGVCKGGGVDHPPPTRSLRFNTTPSLFHLAIRLWFVERIRRVLSLAFATTSRSWRPECVYIQSVAGTHPPNGRHRAGRGEQRLENAQGYGLDQGVWPRRRRPWLAQPFLYLSCVPSFKVEIHRSSRSRTA
jgi:hypothetical protein